MGFSKAPLINNTELRPSENGVAKQGLSSDFKKYQLARIAVLFGYNVACKNDMIVLNGYKHQIVLNSGKMADKAYIINMIALKKAYNDFTNGFSLSKISDKKSYGYEIPNIIPSAEEIYEEADDPILYAERLYQDFDKLPANEIVGNGYKKNTWGKRYRQRLNENMETLIDGLKKSAWGKQLGDSIEYFWSHNDYIINKEEPQTQPGE